MSPAFLGTERSSRHLKRGANIKKKNSRLSYSLVLGADESFLNGVAAANKGAPAFRPLVERIENSEKSGREGAQ